MVRPQTNFVALMAAALLAGSAFAQDKHENHDHAFAKDVDAFHSLLAPLWHADAGKERSRKVCAQADKLESLGREIRGPDAMSLVESVRALRLRCQTDPTRIDEAFARVHEAFHRVAEHPKH